jgi:beta-glucosidase
VAPLADDPSAVADRERWIADRLQALTLDEKATLLAGQDNWRTPSIEHAGIPSVKVTDGPNGARGNGEGRVTAVCFPVGTALAATWNAELIADVGAALAEEAQSKGAQILLGPTVNLHRSPLAGRNFECYSEDPYLTARLAIAYITGLQANGVGACIKHYVANDSEHERMTISSEVDERTLRELYLVPFEMAVAEAKPWSVMAAYNRINGHYACDHRELLVGVLKTEWAFDGLVISDWGAVHDTVLAANGGCDLEMPGPPIHFGAALAEAVRAGTVDDATVDDKVRRVLRTVWRSGRIEHPNEIAEQAIDRPEHRALARRAASEAMVLLKNEPVSATVGPVLPLQPGGDLRTLAVIGPNAEVGVYQGGGSSIVRAHYVVHPLEAITARCGPDVTVVHEAGGTIERYQPKPDPTWFAPLDADGRGLHVEYFDGRGVESGGETVARRDVRSVTWTWWTPPEGVADRREFSVRWTGTLVPPRSGSWQFGLAAIGLARVHLDGELIVDNWTNPKPGELFFSRGSVEVVERVELEADRRYDLRIEYASEREARPPAIRFGMTAPDVEDPVQLAATAARDADVAVVIVGTNGDWETEGSDRPTMALPGRQHELIREVVKANPRTVVVLNTGSPVEMGGPTSTIDDAPAIVQAWFGGQELGNALADVLFGDTDPGGRLPTTFPHRYEDNPALFNYPGEDGKVRYGEGVFIGYRGYGARHQQPRFPFGHGLSYATFAYDGDVEVTPIEGRAPGVRGPLVAEVAVAVTNTGDRRGQEVVQLYVRRSGDERVQRPEIELKGFAKVTLDPSTSTTVTFVLDARSFAYYDTSVPGWVAEAGTYEVLVGRSSSDVRQRTTVTLPESIVLPNT